MESKCKGNLTELQCLAAFVEQGCTVSIPYGDNAKYDFIVEIDKRLYKIQVKTSSLKDEGVIQFSCRSTHVNCTGVKNEKYSPEDVDFFATYWNGKCYIVSINECSAQKNLRFVPPKNGQVKGISFAKDYEIGVQINKLKEVKS